MVVTHKGATLTAPLLPLDRDSFSCGDRSAGKQRGLIDWFLFDAPYSIEGFFNEFFRIIY